jgi:alpha-L-fucosidase 2
MLTKMPDYMINRDGAVKEWTTDRLEENYAHRHAAHLCHLADWLPQDIANDPKLREGFRRAVELKMASRRKAHNRVGVMAFGIVELGQAATSLRDADLAYEAVDMIANRFWRATNMTPTHDPGGVFNMDAAGGLPAVIIKMLVMSEVGGINLLPALPKEWPSGTIEGVLCRGQIEIKELSWDDAQINVRFVSEIPQNVRISVPGSFKEAELGKGNSGMVESLPSKGTCRVAVLPGEVIELQFVR